MKNSIDLIFTRLLQGIAGIALLFFLLCNLYAEQEGTVTIVQKVFFAGGFVALWTAVLYLNADGQPNGQRRQRIYLRGLFCYYIWVLLNVLFFDAGFGRNAARTGVNLEPLLTIRNYLRAYSNGNFPLRLMLINLVGNLVAFAPMGVLLPALFHRMRNLFLFILVMSISICSVELIQLRTSTGSCDIDDLILNLTGALFVWLVVQIPAIKRKLYRALPPKGRK